MTELTMDTFAQAIGGGTLTLVDFWAGWCMPCKIFSPVLEELSREMDGKLNFAKINIDDFPQLAATYEIVSIPTVILFRDGKPLDQLVGVCPKQEVVDLIEKHL